ncbi:uncharacterized protein LOC114312683 [Camellia sinensis]|uniref:uncharacterized protein LOC114312683 n=1 Tax=Camellia sinensis TaxID=4442 RepID=UPI001035EF01|nr:uncharacterized protein LOC114312683 [Camellia sinensis]
MVLVVAGEDLLSSLLYDNGYGGGGVKGVVAVVRGWSPVEKHRDGGRRWGRPEEAVRRSGVEVAYGRNVRTSKNPRISSDLALSTISEIMRDKPLTQQYEVVTILKRDYGLDVSYHMVWLGVEKAKVVIHEDHSLSFHQLRWYSDIVMGYNPRSYVNIDYNASSQQFCRFFVSFVACISGYNSCWPLLFLDGTFLKGKYKGQLFAATTKDRNNETTTNWSWFLHELGKVVNGKRQITFISDRNLGLLETMPKMFPSAHHGHCLQHLKNNLRDWMKRIDNGFRDHLVSSLGDCAYEPIVVGFHEKLEKLKEEEWGMHYGEMTSNAAESFNNWIKEARNLPITQMVDTIHTQLMRQMSWQVSKFNEDVFKVHLMPSVTVDTTRHTCSCFKWQINGFPCDYTVIVIQKSRYNLNDCIEHYFHVETYRAAYSGAIFPIPSVEKPSFDSTDFTIYPPTVKRPPDRPKKNRIPSKDEKLKQISIKVDDMNIYITLTIHIIKSEDVNI